MGFSALGLPRPRQSDPVLQGRLPREKGCAGQGWRVSELLFPLSHFRPSASGLLLKQAYLSQAERIWAPERGLGSFPGGLWKEVSRWQEGLIQQTDKQKQQTALQHGSGRLCGCPGPCFLGLINP